MSTEDTVWTHSKQIMLLEEAQSQSIIGGMFPRGRMAPFHFLVTLHVS